MIFEELNLEEPFPVAREALVGVTAVEKTGSTNISKISLKYITDTTLRRLDLLWMSMTSLRQSKSSRTDSSFNAFQIRHHKKGCWVTRESRTTRVCSFLFTSCKLHILCKLTLYVN